MTGCLRGVSFRHQIGWRSGINDKYEENKVFEDEGGDDEEGCDEDKDGDDKDGGEPHQVRMKVLMIPK